MDEKAERLASFLLKKINRADRQFGLISHGDKVAVAVSGGKDSLSLLVLLAYRRRFVPEKYELCAVHILGDARGTETPKHPPLVQWLDDQGVEYRVVPMVPGPDDEVPLPCHRCARIRRKALVETAVSMGCNKLAFAHHADDLAETTLLNLVYHGKIDTMEPKRDYFGSLELIRPLALTPEQEIIRFAGACGFPPQPPICPRADTSHRNKAKEMLKMAMGCSHQARDNLIKVGLRQLGEESDAT